MKGPFLFPTKAVTLSSAQPLNFQWLLDLCQGSQAQVLGHFLFQFLWPPRAQKCWLSYRGQAESAHVPRLWLWTWHKERQLVGTGSSWPSMALVSLIQGNLVGCTDPAGISLPLRITLMVGKSTYLSICGKPLRNGEEGDSVPVVAQ